MLRHRTVRWNLAYPSVKTVVAELQLRSTSQLI